MKLIDLFETEAAWGDLIKGMDLPGERKTVKPENLRWFLRNAKVRNKAHPNIDRAMVKAKQLMRPGAG